MLVLFGIYYGYHVREETWHFDLAFNGARRTGCYWRAEPAGDGNDYKIAPWIDLHKIVGAENTITINVQYRK